MNGRISEGINDQLAPVFMPKMALYSDKIDDNI